ncbi:MAG: glycosyltransferase [Candidatus Pacebacteria bacterium]|nr:glycosyltransferase [Candidatus Paceibacterota bacterium]
MLSIIVPSLNEEKYLPGLLRSIKRQSFKDFEIIIADADSKDKTIEIAKNLGCRIIKGGLPAKGRNEGAKASKGDLLLFLDADVILSEEFLENSLKEFKRRKLGAASFRLIPLTKKRIVKTAMEYFYNKPITVAEKFIANGAMGILVKKEIFERVGGFNEEVFAEDFYFLRQAAKIEKFGIIRSGKLLITMRRFEADGYLPTLLKYLICNFYMLLGKPMKKDTVFKYEFNHYQKRIR